MPPNLSRISQPSSSLCRTCAKKLQWHRAFATSASLRVVGPENPRYITYPEPPQQPKPKKPPVKGILPVPRKLFGGKRNTKYKTSTLYLDTTNPKPTTQEEPNGPDADRLRWQQRMSDIRRLHFRQGLKELASRQESMEEAAHDRSVANSRRNRALVNAPEREDVRLTTPTITAAIRAYLEPHKPQGRTPQEFERAQQNYARHQLLQKTRRQEALHNLYMHARSFILTEEQLNDAVERTFGSDEDPIVWGPYHDQTIWGTGPPATAERMMKKGVGLEAMLTRQETLMQSRLRRIAEVLTGGKMDTPNT